MSSEVITSEVMSYKVLCFELGLEQELNLKYSGANKSDYSNS